MDEQEEEDEEESKHSQTEETGVCLLCSRLFWRNFGLTIRRRRNNVATTIPEIRPVELDCRAASVREVFGGEVGVEGVVRVVGEGLRLITKVVGRIPTSKLIKAESGVVVTNKLVPIIVGIVVESGGDVEGDMTGPPTKEKDPWTDDVT